jgi:hypothetical protein
MRRLLLFGITVAIGFGIVELSRRTRETDALQEKLHQLQEKFKSLDEVA